MRPEGMKSEEELAQMSDEEIVQYRNSLPKEWIGFPNKYQHWYQDGEWNFKAPIVQQDEASRIIAINEVDEKGVGIESIELSAVEMTLNSVNGTDELLVTMVFDADGEESGLRRTWTAKYMLLPGMIFLHCTFICAILMRARI